ncbi:hypothetical protein HMI56_006022 [Coelomomyces lativittatus]|nr:hypothetical protein HMI56_006022 [Coelomomyces lativittatus]
MVLGFKRFRAWTFVQLLHSYWFLVKGKYPTVIDRLCKIRPHPWPPSQNHRLARQVSYTFMYRQLLWTSVTFFA